MKKLIGGAILLSLALPMSAMAQNTGPGCGLGSMIFKGKSGLGPNILAATTNGISGNQTFGLTFGTLGCNAEQMVSNEYQKEIFVASNMDTLAEEAAKGQGNHLASLAELIGIQSQQEREVFYTLTQANYDKVFVKSNSNATQILAALDDSMKTDAVLAKYVK